MVKLRIPSDGSESGGDLGFRIDATENAAPIFVFRDSSSDLVRVLRGVVLKALEIEVPVMLNSIDGCSEAGFSPSLLSGVFMAWLFASGSLPRPGKRGS